MQLKQLFSSFWIMQYLSLIKPNSSKPVSASGVSIPRGAYTVHYLSKEVKSEV